MRLGAGPGAPWQQGLAHAYSANGAGSVKLSGRSRGDPERAYRAAMRHSRLVRWLRLGVLACIAALLLVVVVANVMPDIGEFQLPGELGKLVIKGTKITMQQPRLAGFTSNSRPYTFTADAAAQDVSNPDFLELRRPQSQDRHGRRQRGQYVGDLGHLRPQVRNTDTRPITSMLSRRRATKAG